MQKNQWNGGSVTYYLLIIRLLLMTCVMHLVRTVLGAVQMYDDDDDDDIRW